MAELSFARWRSAAASGGNRYDDEIVAALGALGVNVREHAITGSWPVPDAEALNSFAEVLRLGDSWLVDNIVGSAAPEAIACATAVARQVTMLVHYFPSDDPALTFDDRQRLRRSEAEAIRVATNVIATSAWTAGEVSARYGRDDAVVAQPGVIPVAAAPGTQRRGLPPVFTWLGRLTAVKDPLTFVEALTKLGDLDWRAQFVGPDSLDVGLTEHLHRRIDEAGLRNRVAVLGTRSGDDLAAVWRMTDLLVHTAKTEPFGMVVTEALSYAIPAVVADGTGAVEAQRVGAVFPSGDASSLAEELRIWLTDPMLRRRWRQEAEAQRHGLPTWEDAARIVASTLAD